MGKCKMPTVQEFLKTKKIYNPIKEPVWVYIEREMRENAARKPYNTKVANWLLFLKDLRYHYYKEAKYKYDRLCKECGPVWYLEYSSFQRKALAELRDNIHEDLLEDLPTRVRKCLWDLGVTIFFPHDMLMTSMAESFSDPGLFMWILYTKYYTVPPSVQRPWYDWNAKLLMSSLVFIDMEECIELLNHLTERVKRPPSHPKKKKSTYFEPNVKYGEYLQDMRVPFYSNHPLKPPKRKRPMPLKHKIHLRTDASYENLLSKTTFMEKRRERNSKLLSSRKCKYKFWVAPPSFRNTDPKMALYISKLNMFKTRARSKHLRHKPPVSGNYVISSVSYSSGVAVYVLGTYVPVNTGYTIINGGQTKYNDEYVTQIYGMWNVKKPAESACPKNCDCASKWESKVFSYLKSSRCHCHHYYDFEHPTQLTQTRKETGPEKERFFHPPSRNIPLFFDHAKIYQKEPVSDNVYEAFREALNSTTPESNTTKRTLDLHNLSARELLKIFLADLADTPLMIPHLPQANLLNNLQEWVRKRIRGNISPARHKKLMLKSQRRWLDLKHIDFRAQAYFIPFTLNQLQHMTWAHRGMVQKLFEVLLKSFEMRTRENQLEQSRLWWSTMEYDVYPSESFLDVFFTYMPGRYKDTLVVNPYCAKTMQYTGRTCPLNARQTV